MTLLDQPVDRRNESLEKIVVFFFLFFFFLYLVRNKMGRVLMHYA